MILPSLVSFAVIGAVYPTPTENLINYGVLGIFAVLAIYAIKKMYDTINTTYKERLAEKDAQIALKDDMIERLQGALSNNILPSMNKQAEVMENLPNKETAMLQMMSKMETDMRAIAGRVESALASIPEGERE